MANLLAADDLYQVVMVDIKDLDDKMVWGLVCWKMRNNLTMPFLDNYQNILLKKQTRFGMALSVFFICYC